MVEPTVVVKPASELQIGDQIVEQRGRKVLLVTVESIRRGGYVPEARTIVTKKKAKRRRSVPIAVSPTPNRMLESKPVIVNEEMVFDRIAQVRVFDPKAAAVNAIHQMAQATASNREAA